MVDLLCEVAVHAILFAGGCGVAAMEPALRGGRVDESCTARKRR
jgi:hypothetical protein